MTATDPQRSRVAPTVRRGNWRHRTRWLALPAGWPALPRNNADSADTADEGAWLVLADPALSAELAGSTASPVEALAPSVLDGDITALADLLAGVDKVLYAPPISADPVDVESAYREFHAAGDLPPPSSQAHRSRNCSS